MVDDVAICNRLPRRRQISYIAIDYFDLTPKMLKIRPVAGRKVVENNHFMSSGQEVINTVAADEPSATRNKNSQDSSNRRHHSAHFSSYALWGGLYATSRPSPKPTGQANRQKHLLDNFARRSGDHTSLRLILARQSFGLDAVLQRPS